MRTAGSGRRFTVDEFHRMGTTGILAPGEGVELVDGQVVQMAPIGNRHAACVGRLTRILAPFAADLIVWIQNPVRLDGYTELVPDVAVLRARADFYEDTPPGPEDVLLLIEVAETSTEYDRRTKAPRYARAGVTEVWLVDLPSERIEVFRDPLETFAYTDTMTFQRGAVVTCERIGLSVTVDDIIG